MNIRIHKKNNIMLRLASVLLVLLLVSTCMLAGLLAKYTATSSESDGARAAGFSVSVVNDTNDSNMDMNLGDINPLATYALDIKNDSEVAVRYEIEIDFSDALPDGVDVFLSNKGDGSEMLEITPIVRDTFFSYKYKFEDVGEMQPNSQETKYLVFTPNESNTVYEHLGTDERYEQKNDFIVDVTFVQID